MSRTIKRKKTGSKAVSHICRNNGECAYCNKNRLYKNLKKSALRNKFYKTCRTNVRNVPIISNSTIIVPTV